MMPGTHRISVGVLKAYPLLIPVSSSCLQARISAPPTVAGLPEGITQRDDIYTKTEAFLTHVPNLD